MPTTAPPAPPAPPTPPPPSALPRPTRVPFGGDALRCRLVALALLAAALSLLIVSARLEPNPTGMGTHTQLGLRPCGFEVATGFPCATCGMTTAFALATDGQLIHAFLTQPAGALLALLTAMTALLAAWSLWSAMPLLPIVQALWRPSVVIAAIVVVLLAWAYTAAEVSLRG